MYHREPARATSGAAATAPDLSVVIVSFNTRGLLGQCLASLQDGLRLSAGSNAPPPISAEFVVVDNASSDGSAESVSAIMPRATVIANPANRGFAAASNQGLSASHGRYLLLLNPDTVVRPRSLARLVRFLDQTPHAGAAGPRLLNPDGTLQDGCFRFPTLPMAFFDFFPLHHRLLRSSLNGRYRPRGADDPPFPVDHPLGACLLVRREAMESVGLLDERFFIYCEEVDWCLRLKAAGWSIWCVPSAEVVHYGGQSTQQSSPRMFVELFRSRYQLFAKHYPPGYNRAARGIIRLGAVTEALRAWRRYSRGEMARAQRDARWRACGEVFRL